MARKPTPKTPKPTQLSEWTPDWIQYLNATNAFKCPQDDPDSPLIQRAQLLRNELKAKAGINRLFGTSHPMPTDAAKTVDDLINALIGREYVIKSQISKNYSEEPRPKKTPTNRSLTIESMHRWRTDDHTLDEFIESAKAGSVDGLELEESEKNNKRVFKLAWDSLIQKDTKTVTHSTLEKWWAAGKTKPNPL
jgi:hypothetical protein